MRYTETAAAEIATRWNVSAATLRTWRHRGEIPDFYASSPELLFKAARRVNDEWLDQLEGSIRALGSDAWSDYLRYIQETQVQGGLPESEIMRRLRDKRTHLRKKYT